MPHTIAVSFSLNDFLKGLISIRPSRLWVSFFVIASILYAMSFLASFLRKGEKLIGFRIAIFSYAFCRMGILAGLSYWVISATASQSMSIEYALWVYIVYALCTTWSFQRRLEANVSFYLRDWKEATERRKEVTRNPSWIMELIIRLITAPSRIRVPFTLLMDFDSWQMEKNGVTPTDIRDQKFEKKRKKKHHRNGNDRGDHDTRKTAG